MLNWLRNLFGVNPTRQENPRPAVEVFVHHKGTAYEPADAETQFFRNKYGPPLTQAVVRGKRTPAEMTPLQKVAMAFGFPLFLGRAVVDPQGAALPEWTSRIPAEMANDPTIRRQLSLHGQLRRRYSGDVHNPISRSRYVALSGASGSCRRTGCWAS